MQILLLDHKQIPRKDLFDGRLAKLVSAWYSPEEVLFNLYAMIIELRSIIPVLTTYSPGHLQTT
jgi:hypothetical protein